MVTADRSSPPQAATVSLARLPVFDDKRRLWGYELFRVGGVTAPGDSANTESAATSLAKSAYIGLQNMLDRGKKIVLDLSLIHISEPTRQESRSRMPSSA